MLRLSISLGLAVAVAVGPLHAAGQPAGRVVDMAYADAAPVFAAVSESRLPAELQRRAGAERAAAWPAWVSRHDAQIRERLAQGDDDSVINLLLFGATFTGRPRLKEDDILARVAARHGARLEQDAVVQGRIDDLMAGLASPGVNERLQFARHVVERRGFSFQTSAGRADARRHLEGELTRVLQEYERYYRTQAARARAGRAADVADDLTLFRDRGLSSDTSILPDFAIDQALEALASLAILGRPVRRVAIVGPGLDFTDKREGDDFYPQQTLQPFAVVDSLLRLGFAAQNDLTVTTFDVSPRINGHLDAARERARAGAGYTLHLPRRAGWRQELVEYWRRFGRTIGSPEQTSAPPPSAGAVDVRAVTVRPQVVLSIVPRDLNIVLQRFEPGAGDEGFDLIVATNVLIYYDVFEQCLALTNIARMLTPHGVLLTNSAVFEVPGLGLTAAGYNDVSYTGRPSGRDRVYWFARQPVSTRPR